MLAAENGEQALAAIDTILPNLLTLDMDLPRGVLLITIEGNHETLIP